MAMASYQIFPPSEHLPGQRRAGGQCCRGELDVAGAAQATEYGEQRPQRPPSRVP